MDDNKDSLTRMMEKAKLEVPEEHPNKTPVPKRSFLHERTRAAWRVFKPAVKRTWWWVLLGVAVLMVMWEVDDLWSGTIYEGLNWTRDHVLKRFPIVPFGLGMMVYHYILRSERGRRDG